MKDIVISGSTYPGVEQILFDTPSGKRATFVDCDTVRMLPGYITSTAGAYKCETSHGVSSFDQITTTATSNAAE